MASTINERVFVLGATGNIGSKVVTELLAKNIAVTIYVRDQDKAAKVFANQIGSLTIVEGGYDDLSAMEKALPGHTRMFLMVYGHTRMVATKTEIATLAFAAGVKQIVDLSCTTFNASWRNNAISQVHLDAEEAMLKIPNRGYVVSLRPSRFMSNMVYLTPSGFTQFEDFLEPDSPQSWISPNDIADVAAVVLAGNIEDHEDSAYELTSQVATPTELAEALTHAAGRTITYKQVTPLERFNTLKVTMANLFPVSAIYAFASMIEINPHVSLGISILLGREPESLDAYFARNKHALTV
ncbi:hypothetical protein BCR42DRAFT_429159 [Absidia repens]|uniref:NmrA-like domain-containing protein n=1 Tax=Absidia repens TaxID=90262 RepID=A0A1X2HXJ6_9FUNG|nr:hypothetical protein BCR42DRAFT_429159 [Absidia repens]